MYTYIDGLITKKLELKDYLKERVPDAVCLTETKLRKNFELTNIGKEKYDIWRKD